MKKILFIIKNKNEASSRFRVSAYLPYLKNDFNSEIFYAEYNNQKVPKIFRSFIKRFRFLFLLLSVKQYDVIFMQRPMSSDKTKGTTFERLITKFNSNLIFDFDDALFVQNETKIKALCKLSKHIVCGNSYLYDFSNKYNKNSHIIPTTIDTNSFVPSNSLDKPLVIGWTGTSGNYANFSDTLINTLSKIITNVNNISILFICDKRPPEHFKFKYDFIKWEESTELNDLQKIDIGIMPLIDSEWTRGKCGFKLIQYGAIGIASVGSNVGVNNQVIIDNETGFLINNEDEWLEKLNLMITEEKLRTKMGEKAREHIIKNYDTANNYNKLYEILMS